VHTQFSLRITTQGAYFYSLLNKGTNGHGQGQLRRIATNGTDWLALRAYNRDESLAIEPGPISSYMIIAPEDALLEQRQISASGRTALFPRTNTDGSFIDHPNINYNVQPLCIHRAPVNINTATDKVLVALFMGINVQHGHPMSVGTGYPSNATTNADLSKLSSWPRPNLYSAGGSSSTLSNPCTIANPYTGMANLKDELLPDNPGLRVTETPSFHVQPFRWNHIGCRFQSNSQCDTAGTGVGRRYVKGQWHTWQNQAYFWGIEDPRYKMVYNFVAGHWNGTSWDDSTEGIYRQFIATQRHHSVHRSIGRQRDRVGSQSRRRIGQ